MSQRIFEAATYLFDPLHAFWESKSTHRRVASLLALVFLAGIIGIELKRRGLLPSFLAEHAPTNHFHAVNLAFTLLLILEVVGLIFALPSSFSRSVGKQFEILCLILMRNSFKELVNFPEPISVTHVEPLLRIMSDGSGALIVFVLLGVYYRLQRPKEDIVYGESLYSMVAMKKIIALGLFAAFAGMGVVNAWQFVTHGPEIEFFTTFYTILIFNDILLVLISQRYLPAFRAVFRNSGFALCTLLIRLALAAPPFYNAALGVGAMGFAVCLTLACRRFSEPKE